MVWGLLQKDIVGWLYSRGPQAGVVVPAANP